jgi:hypothetical protein
MVRIMSDAPTVFNAKPFQPLIRYRSPLTMAVAPGMVTPFWVALPSCFN